MSNSMPTINKIMINAQDMWYKSDDYTKLPLCLSANSRDKVRNVIVIPEIKRCVERAIIDLLDNSCVMNSEFDAHFKNAAEYAEEVVRYELPILITES